MLASSNNLEFKNRGLKIPDYQKHKLHRICIHGMMLVSPCTIKKNTKILKQD